MESSHSVLSIWTIVRIGTLDLIQKEGIPLLWHVLNSSFCLLLIFVYWVVLAGFGKLKRIRKDLTLFLPSEPYFVLVCQQEGPKHVPQGCTWSFCWKYDLTSLDNSSNTIKKVRTAMEGWKKCGVKPGSNIKADKTHKYWYLACEAYQKLASQYIKMKRGSFFNSSHCAAWFTVTKSEDQYFWRFIIKFDNGKLEASAVIRSRSNKYVEMEKKLIQYLDLRAHRYAQDTCGVRWIFMENKCLKFAEGLGLNDFKD